MRDLRFRQIHLDFHTSEHIPGVGSAFDADAFGDTLARAYVDSVTLFSRCHHGWIYHDTRFPSRHPHLTCNLLGEQIAACHRRDIRCPIYITVGFDEFMAREHPEWVQRYADGRLAGAGPLQAGWRHLCFASPYVEYVLEQTAEVLDLFGDEVDGFFFDIMLQPAVHGPYAMQEFARQGWDPGDEAAQNAMRALVVDRFKERATALVRASRPDATVFHNAGHISPAIRHSLHAYSHLELESLPSGGWGYAHFPITMRYARTLGLPCLGMTGKFAKMWGHFNSYKPQAALDYECFQALALGAACSVGDQLHPMGRLDDHTYEMVGATYSHVAACEPWCRGAERVSEVGVFNVEALGRHEGRIDPASRGAMRALTVAQCQFDLVDGDADWSAYPLVVLPDKVRLDPSLAAVCGRYLAGGGALLLSHESGLDARTGEWALEGGPVAAAEGPLPHHPDFLAARPGLPVTGGQTPQVCYERGTQVTPAPGAEALADIWEPYFNRTWEHFCSHAHTPPAGPGPHPGALQTGRVIYFAHPLFTLYGRHGMDFYRELIAAAVGRLAPAPLVETNAPTTLQITVNRQPSERRMVVHLLHYIPERRTEGEEMVEETVPLGPFTVSLRVPRPSRVYLAPGGEDVNWDYADGSAVIHVPGLRGHAMLVVDEGGSHAGEA